MRVLDVIKSKYMQGKKRRTYPPSSLAYDIRSCWATTSPTAPPAYQALSTIVATILPNDKCCLHDGASDDAITPFADILLWMQSTLQRWTGLCPLHATHRPSLMACLRLILPSLVV
jgi:hypothetical protein